MIVVSDSSPLINLSAIGRLELLPALFGTVLVPPIVWDEITGPLGLGKPGEIELKKAEWVEVRPCADHHLFNLLRKRLDPGEAEAIALAVELNASTLLIDERRGRTAAQQEMLSTTGILGVLIEAKRAGLLTSVTLELDALLTFGFFIHQDLYEHVKALCHE